MIWIDQAAQSTGRQEQRLKARKEKVSINAVRKDIWADSN
jgi:hypothetical protein